MRAEFENRVACYISLKSGEEEILGRKKNRKNITIVQDAADKVQGTKANRCYKDTVFRMLFRDKKQLMELYNAVSGRHYENPEEFEIVTLEGVVYMGIKNDLAFLIDFNLYLFEHQSTVNVNMPLRFLQYVAAEYGKLTVLESLYGGSRVEVPAPHFVVFYNGVDVCEERRELRLSESFQKQEGEPELELRVQVLNINEGFNKDLKKQCWILEEYMQYVDKVRAYAQDMPITQAVDKAVDECIEQDILRDFLLKNKAEVKQMSIFEYDEEATRRAMKKYEREQGRAEGKTEGRVEDILLLLDGKGILPESVQKIIQAERNPNILQKWLKLAAKVQSTEAFIEKMNQGSRTD